MDNISILVYTMKGCPFCEQFKELLEKDKIQFIDRDIHENEDEYNLFVKATDNELIPALLVLENPTSKKPVSYLYAPERDYNDLNEAIEIVKKHLVID